LLIFGLKENVSEILQEREGHNIENILQLFKDAKNKLAFSFSSNINKFFSLVFLSFNSSITVETVSFLGCLSLASISD
jgi:hypothetical protein